MLARALGFGRRPFSSLSEQEILALAISSEEDDGRIYRAYADGLREGFPQSAKVFDEMATEEERHRVRLIDRAHYMETPRAARNAAGCPRWRAGLWRGGAHRQRVGDHFYA